MDIAVKEEYLKRAAALHKEIPVVDAHLDLAGEILLRRQLLERQIIKNHYLRNWHRAGIRLVVSSVYVPDQILQAGGTEAAWVDAQAQIQALSEEINETEEIMAVRNGRELQQALKGDRIGILLYMEGLDCIGKDIGRLKTLYEKGVRGASLTWSRQNALAAGCCKAGQRIQIPGGLTEEGKEAVREMERLHMFLDISHLNDDGFEDIKKTAKQPFCATHSCAKAVYENYRNLTDEQMTYLAKQGGVMGLNGCKYIAGSQKGNHLEMLCHHAEYEIAKIGASHVGFGFDLCDSYEEARHALQRKQAGCRQIEEEADKGDCFVNHSQILLLSAALLQRGMEEEKLSAVMGKSFIRYFETVLPS